MAKRYFANKLSTLVILMIIAITLLPNSMVSGTTYWSTKKTASFRSEYFDGFSPSVYGTGVANWRLVYGTTTLDLRAKVEGAWSTYSYAYVNADWDTSKYQSGGKYSGLSGKEYRAIVYFDAIGDIRGYYAYMRVSATLRSASQILGTGSRTFTSSYDGSFSVTTTSSTLASSSDIYVEVTVRVYAYTPVLGPWTDSNAYYNGAVDGQPDYNVTLTSFKIQQGYNYS